MSASGSGPAFGPPPAPSPFSDASPFSRPRAPPFPSSLYARPPTVHTHHYTTVNTNGSITQDEEVGEVIQLQGDQRQNAREWLLAQEVVSTHDAERIVIHGF